MPECRCATPSRNRAPAKKGRIHPLSGKVRWILRGWAKVVKWSDGASLAFPYAPLVRWPAARCHGRARASAGRCRLSARCVAGLARWDACHPGSGRPPPSSRRPRKQPPSRRIGAPRTPARAQRRHNGCSLLPIHTRAGVRLRDTPHGHFSRPSPDPIPGDVGYASRHALTGRTAALWVSGEGSFISALALCPAQAPNPTPPDPHYAVAVEARRRPGSDARRLAERGRVRRKSR
jgi:hypothetical protein